MTLEEAIERNSYQCLFYALCTELRSLPITGKGLYRKSVTMKTILELEGRYQMAETAMIAKSCQRVKHLTEGGVSLNGMAQAAEASMTER